MISDLFPRPGELRDRQAERDMAALAAAIPAGGPEMPDPRYAPYAERIRQAEQKIAAGQPVKRIPELMALLQFGPGSVGRAVADACAAPAAAFACEAQFIADGLVAVAARSPEAPHLLPDDLRRRHGAGDSPEDAVPRAALGALLDRAAATIPAPSASGHRGLDRFLARRAAFCARRIDRLRRTGPGKGGGADVLTALDRAVVGLRLLLGRIR